MTPLIRDKYANHFDTYESNDETNRQTDASSKPLTSSLNPTAQMGVVMAGKSKDSKTATDRARTISRHSLSYMLCAISEMFRFYDDFDPLDLLIVHAVLNANVIPVMKDPELDRRFGSVQAVEPDAIKQGVSRAALSRFLAMPIETVRRRANGLKKKGILRDTDDGLIVTEANQFKFGNNHVLQKTNILLVRKFLRDLTESDIDVPGGI
jgi:hypothetical protein